MPLRKPNSLVLLENLFGIWIIHTPAVGGYWIRANPDHPYHPIVLAFYGYQAKISDTGEYLFFHAPNNLVHSYLDRRTGLPLSVPKHPTRCANSGKRVPRRGADANYDARQHTGVALCNECQKRVPIEFSYNKLYAWLYTAHEPKDFYRDLPTSITASIPDHPADTDTLPHF